MLVASTAQVIATAAPSTDGLSCPQQDDPQRPLYLPHPQSCAQYYLCYHGTPLVMTCPNMLLFDVIQQSCNAAELVNCQVIQDIFLRRPFCNFSCVISKAKLSKHTTPTVFASYGNGVSPSEEL